MGQAIGSVHHLEIHPPILGIFSEFVFLSEFLGDVRKFDSNIFGLFQWGLQIKISRIKARKFYAREGTHTVDHQLYQVEIGGGRSDIEVDDNMPAGHCGAGTVWVLLLRANFAHDPQKRSVFSSVGKDVAKVNDPECVHASNALLFGSLAALTNSLAELPDFIGVGGLPDVV